MTYGRGESTGRADALFFCTLNEGKQWGKLVLCEDRWRDLWICVREVIIPELSEPPVRTLRATIPENESQIFR